MGVRRGGVLQIFGKFIEPRFGGDCQFVQEFAQVCRKRCAGFEPLAGAGMWESQFEGMEKLPTERRQFGFIDMKMGRCSIESVSDERVFSGREMYSNLMRSAGVELD